jgi:hypothetical protein
VWRLDPTRLDLALPRPWVCVLLVLAFLGFGVIVGRTAASAGNSQLSASARPQLRLVLPASTTSTSGASSTSSSVTPPPVAESTSTPSSETPSSASSSETSETGGSGEGSGSAQGEGKKTGASSNKGAGAGKHAGAGGSSGGSSGGGHSGGKSTGAGGGSGGGSGSATGSTALPPVKHVFLVMLADQPYASVFGPASAAPYLAGTLERRGELLVRYYAVAHDELADGIALLSGQGPTPQTEVNCPTYAPIAPASVGADEQVQGQGCVYPASTKTLMGELTAKHLTWKAYVEGMGPGGSSATCLHPAVGAADATLGPTPPAASATGPAVDQVPPAYEAAPGEYATFRNPFVYFQSVIGASACAADDVSLAQLAGDLESPARTPNLSYVVPSLCDDGSPLPCTPGAPAGMAPADAFLHKVVPEILASKAYKHGGLLVITVDQAPSTGADADSSSCCGQPSFPDLPAPAAAQAGLRAPGGGQVGALLLSPYVKSGTTDAEPFDDFSLLRTIENLFGLAPLGYAVAPHVGAFEASVFTAYSG